MGLVSTMLCEWRMNIGIYNAASTLSSLEKWQEVTSQNIAAGSVPGYKGNQMSFEEIQAGMMGVNASGRMISVPVSMSEASSKFNFANGQITQTGVPTHVALNSEGFFKIQGDGFEYYTRDGEFHVNAEGQIVNKTGQAVLGENGPMSISPQYGEISINGAGEIKQGAVVVGKLSIVDVEDKEALIRIPGGFRLVPDSDVAVNDVLKSVVVQGNLEDSNVSPLKEMVNLISISRAFEVNHKVIQSLDEIQSKTIEVMGATG
jgi:flagellar basal-body rod protein FlgF